MLGGMLKHKKRKKKYAHTQKGRYRRQTGKREREIERVAAVRDRE